MRLIARLNEREIDLCGIADVKIEDKDYDEKDIKKVEDKLLSYLNANCIDENDNETELGIEYEDLIEKLVDYEDEINPENPIIDAFAEEDDKVVLKDRQNGNNCRYNS